MERAYAHRPHTLEEKGGGEGAPADLIAKIGFGLLHACLLQNLHQIGVSHALPLHLSAEHSLGICRPIAHETSTYDANVIRYDANPLDLLGLDHHIRCERNALEDESQHFLLSTQARTLDLKRVARMSEEEGWQAFVKIRFAENDGEPFCPRCACSALYAVTSRRKWKCKACQFQFSVTSGTIFASRKLQFRDILFAIALFTNGAKGMSALQLSRDLNVQHKTAFVLLHKIRESLGTLQHATKLSGEVEMDGAYYGGYVKPSTRAVHRRDRRKLANQSGKRKCVTVMRERNGRTRPFICSELEGAKLAPNVIEGGSIVYADEAKSYDSLHALFEMKRIDHSKSYAEGEVSTNQAESFHSRMRRSEKGVHHRIAEHLDAYANEMAWREDNRRASNGEQFLTIAAAGLHHPISRRWKGYWQRRKEAA